MAQNLWADGKYSAYTSPDLCYFPAIQQAPDWKEGRLKSDLEF